MVASRALPVPFLDLGVRCLRDLCDLTIRVDLAFDHRLDGARLARALEMVQEAEPVLASRLAPGPWRPRWVPVPPGERPLLIALRNHEAADRFLLTPLDPVDEPPFQVAWVDHPGGSRLLFRVAHEAADVGGTRAAVDLVARAYRLLGDEPGAVADDLGPRPSRSLRTVLSEVPGAVLAQAAFGFAREQHAASVPASTVQAPLRVDGGSPAIIARDLPAGAMRAARAEAHERGATMNELMTAAFLRVLASHGRAAPGARFRLATSVDLWRHWGGDGPDRPIANLSSVHLHDFGPDAGTDLETTLNRVRDRMAALKSRGLGLGIQAGALALRALPANAIVALHRSVLRAAFRRGTIPPGFTNTGVFRPAEADFNGPAVRARLLPPMAWPPALIAAASEYQGTVTLSAVTPPESWDGLTPNDFLDAWIREMGL